MEVHDKLATPTSPLPVAIIGAGPYGLSLGAHLRQRGIDFRIFGEPMFNWRFRMPKGMLLKSEAFASNLVEPLERYTLQHFYAEQGLHYEAIGSPVPVETFAAYGMWFQRQTVPEVESTDVTGVDQVDGTFQVSLATGETVEVERVVVAAGISHFSYMPTQLHHLPSDLVSHSSDHFDLGRFAGQDVIVLGAGQSALETAALLHEHGAQTRVLARCQTIVWNPNPAPEPRPVLRRIRHPQAGLGPGWRSRFLSDAPMVFRHFPAGIRVQQVRRRLGPAGAWWLRDRVEGQIPLLVGQSLVGSEPDRDGLRLRVQTNYGEDSDLWAQHVIAATGYRADVSALPFLSAGLRRQIRRTGTAPALSGHFESSVRGLYFVGLAAANTFGPVQRFVYGAGFTAGRVSRHLAAAVNATKSRDVGSLLARRSVRR